MKKPIIVANWKAYLAPDAERAIALSIGRVWKKKKKGSLVLCPSFLSISGIAAALTKQGLPGIVGAQDCSGETIGAHTGELTAHALRAAGARTVIIGHSERRQHGETDVMIGKKISAALAEGLTPILCIGEKLNQKKSRDTVIAQQLERALHGVVFKPRQQLLIAYEPVWAIGSGTALEPQEFGAIRDCIVRAVFRIQSSDFASRQLSILYGGSITSDSAARYCAHGADGVLVGSASTDVKHLIRIINALVP